MAWTTPRTWVAGEVLTAALLNTHLKNNLLETAPAKATAAGQLFVATAANAIAARTVTTGVVATSQGTSSTSYTDLATTGPAASSVSTGATAILWLASLLSNNSAGNKSFHGYAVSGDTTIAAADASAMRFASDSANQEARMCVVQAETGLTPGSNTFTSKYKSNGSTATFADRRIVVLPL